MSISLGNVIAQGVIGAVGGAAQGGYQAAMEQMKQESERVKEERLSKLRMQEHVANRTADMALKNAQDDKDAAEASSFYNRTALPAKTTTSTVPYTDVTGDGTEGANAGTPITSEKSTPPSKTEQTAYRLAEAQKTGKKGLIEQAMKADEDARRDRDQERKDTAEERRLKAVENANANAQRRQDETERHNTMLEDLRNKQLDAFMAKANGKDNDLPRDKFDAARWEKSYKTVADTLVDDDPISGKAKPDYAARRIARAAMNQMKAQGMEPEDAENAVGAAVASQSSKARAFIAAKQGKPEDYEQLVAAGVIDQLSRQGVEFDAGPGPNAAPAKAAPAATATPAPAPAPKAESKGVIAAVRSAEPDYTPPGDSPAGQAAARRAQLERDASAKSIKTVEDAAAKANAAVASGSAEDAQAAMDMPGFASLPLNLRTKINALVYGRR